MHFKQFTKRLVASFAMVSAIGAISMEEGVFVPPSSMTEALNNKPVATATLAAPQGMEASRTMLMGFADLVSSTGKESDRLYDLASARKQEQKLKSSVKGWPGVA